MSIGCTGCKYCMPCPKGVSIPEIFKLYNSYQLVKPHPIDKMIYTNAMQPAGSGADQCVNCGICAKHCPQGLEIPQLLQMAHAEFTV
ncbi:MAG: 4Fe-4S dicluster domain-containing protein [Anaerocolumna sp.]